MKNWCLVFVAVALTGCQSMTNLPYGKPLLNGGRPGETGIGYGYYPLDPLPLQVDSSMDKAKILKALPDETIRMAIGEVKSDGGISFGATRVGAASRSYVVIVDYMKYTTQILPAKISAPDKDGARTASVVQDGTAANAIIPLYVGIGLRMTASIYVVSGEVDLGSLFGLGAAAKANQITGTLIVQNMGIGSKEATDLLPMPNAISDASIQQAIISLASIKTKVYDAAEPTPRVLGIYNTLGGNQETINGVIGGILSHPIDFPPKAPVAKTSSATVGRAGGAGQVNADK
ncbi:hypothetical protein ACFJGX_15790 [Hydrogenophaga sp. UC242_50]|uniref:hypothetical protein n=2 Tax=unclassified Hydrogenophaga TaxID=2610897 RepID=UPI0036D35A1B